MNVTHLVVESEWCSELDPLLYAHPQDPLIWWQNDIKMVGVGVAARLRASGPKRIQDLNRAWQLLSQAARVTDRVNLACSGLVGFGTITFAADSKATSLLTVPETIVAEVAGKYFVTRIKAVKDAATSAGDTCCPPLQPPCTEIKKWSPVSLRIEPDQAQLADYTRSAEKSFRALSEGTVAKIVLARQSSVTIDKGADLRAPIAWLAREYPSCTVFSVDGFFGATPETLVHASGGSFSSRVLAGTASAHDFVDSAAATAWLADNPQIAREHFFAADSVIAAVKPLVSDLTWNDDPLVIKLPNVLHRATDISGRINPGQNSLDLLAAMHPTAAVAGTPTDSAIRLIGEIEGFDRGRYAGAVGWINRAGDGDWALGLRCAQVVAGDTSDSRRIVVTAGGGLVEDSRLAAELAETSAKMVPLRDCLALA